MQKEDQKCLPYELHISGLLLNAKQLSDCSKIVVDVVQITAVPQKVVAEFEVISLKEIKRSK